MIHAAKDAGSPLKNQRGQIAIFMALIFQVLFIFFAMVINVGLLIHDKINLQNSVDLAAYYAAEREAEILNAIGHTNYQIRQAWKLLAWRIRVIGDMGRMQHPALSPNVPATDTALYPDGSAQIPSVCTNYSFWQGDSKSQDLCQNQSLRIPPIPPVKNLAPFLGFNQTIKDFVEKMGTIYVNECRKVGPANWQLAVRWMATFRSDSAARKKVIRELAMRLSENTDFFKELSGADVRDGVFKTIQKNLTRANANNFSRGSVDFFNALGKFSNTNTNAFPVWLHPIPVNPVVYYTDAYGETMDGCQGNPRQIINNNLPQALARDPSLARQFNSDLFLSLQNEPSDINDLDHSIIGVEKNPWYLAYVGIQVTTRPAKPFAPFGQPVTLTARAFAKPFGASIGPWYKTAWKSGSTQSDGPSKTDMLLPDEATESGGIPPNDFNIPNYSRYPGDTLGLRSRQALAGMRLTMLRTFQQQRKSLNRAFWGYLPEDFSTDAKDPLAWEKPPLPNAPMPNSEPWIRMFEIAAIAPDLFDITYYPIDPNFEKAYREKTVLTGEVQMRSDLGYHAQVPSIKSFSVAQQVGVVKSYFGSDAPNRPASITDWRYLLTSWVPRPDRAYDQFPEGQLMKCSSETAYPLADVLNPNTPSAGGCRVGGRTGYSVKIISKNWLMRDNLVLGGENEAGPILNKPPW